ncbi:hypothetical protein [Fischerella sp. PCC 9605]|uniref:hypothetical protein n=1 Tax=Fischerella sp. PCC 9605 TaxID=1173024 RepID=UPI00047DA208|nr:hypothetical protein [Fischerella sp. PCC 9605]
MLDNQSELDAWIQNPGDTELAELFREIEECEKRFDAKLKKLKSLSTEITDRALALEFDCAKFIYQVRQDLDK